METVIVQGEERRIARSGGTQVLYIPREAKGYFSPGDTVKVSVKIADDHIIITAEKKLHNFEPDDIRGLAKEHGFSVEYDKQLGDISVFNAVRGDSLSLSYTYNHGSIEPMHVALSRKFQDLDLESYRRVNSLAEELKKGFDAIVEVEGDLDVIDIMKEPERYGLKQDEAFEMIRESGRRVGLSLVIRFDSRKDTLEEVGSALEQLTKLETADSVA